MIERVKSWANGDWPAKVCRVLTDFGIPWNEYEQMKIETRIG